MSHRRPKGGSSGYFDIFYVAVAQFEMMQFKLSDSHGYYKNSKSLIAIYSD